MMSQVNHASKDLSLGKTCIANHINLILLLKPALYSSSLVKNFLKVGKTPYASILL